MLLFLYIGFLFFCQFIGTCSSCLLRFDKYLFEELWPVAFEFLVIQSQKFFCSSKGITSFVETLNFNLIHSVLGFTIIHTLQHIVFSGIIVNKDSPLFLCILILKIYALNFIYYLSFMHYVLEYFIWLKWQCK